MKRKFFLLIFIVIFSSKIFCQEKNSIQISPLHFTNMPLGIDYQRTLNRYFNFDISFLFSFYDFGCYYYDFSQIDIPKVSVIRQTFEYGLNVGLIFRPFGNYLNGFYLGLFQGINLIMFDNKNNIKILLPTQIQSGYQWIFTHGVTLSLGLGFGIKNQISDNIIMIDNNEYLLLENKNKFFNKFLIYIRLGIGYSW